MGSSFPLTNIFQDVLNHQPADVAMILLVVLVVEAMRRTAIDAIEPNPSGRRTNQ